MDKEYYMNIEAKVDVDVINTDTVTSKVTYTKKTKTLTTLLDPSTQNDLGALLIAEGM